MGWALTGLTDEPAARAENVVLTMRIAQTESLRGFPKGKQQMFTMLPKPDFFPLIL